MIEASRRGFIGRLIAFVAAPAIVRVSSLMPVRAYDDISFRTIAEYVADQPVDRLDILYGAFVPSPAWQISMYKNSNSFLRA